ncbi:MAG: sugar kinase [Eubacteriales bacterium]|nr:sugar kinase [Eubacteriales bacterium]
MKKCVCFGEILLRLCPPDGTRIGQTEHLTMTFAGAEANVAASLKNYGLDASFVTKLPKDNAVAEAFLYQMRGFGVDTSDIAFGGERMGLFFLEQALSVRPAKVLYDRKNSAIANIRPGDIDWDKAFEGASWFHWSGITPALSEACAQETMAACRIAKSKGIKISCDLNYRKPLWTPEQAQKTMTPLMPYVDVIIANESEPKDLFGMTAPADLYENGQLTKEGYVYLAEKMTGEFGSAKCGFAIREKNAARDYIWSGLLYDRATGKTHATKKYPLTIADRIGAGDAFSAGLVAALMQDRDDDYAVRFATAVSAYKHTFMGDFNRVTVAEAEAIM